jgi:hypothetical protein
MDAPPRDIRLTPVATPSSGAPSSGDVGIGVSKVANSAVARNGALAILTPSRAHIGGHSLAGNTCESRASYTAANIRFGHRFADALRHDTDGTLTVELEEISHTLPEDPEKPCLPQCF